MPDVTCRVCGEPWDTWGATTGEGDLSRDEYRQLLRGEGCPSCHGFAPCECGHRGAMHRANRILAPDSGPECLGSRDDPDPCACHRYQPIGRLATDRAHFDSIEGEDAEAWERFA